MKIRPLYIYVALVILAFVILFFASQNNDSSSEVPSSISGKEMPKDAVHEGLTENPSGANVSKEFKAKMEALKKEVDANPNDTLKMREYADLLTASHQPNKALPYYQKILNKDPKRKDILFSLTFIYYTDKNYDKAEEITNKILTYDKNDLEAVYNLGAIAAARGNKAKAKDIWTKLVKEHPDAKAAKLAQNSLTQLK